MTSPYSMWYNIAEMGNHEIAEEQSGHIYIADGKNRYFIISNEDFEKLWQGSERESTEMLNELTKAGISAQFCSAVADQRSTDGIDRESESKEL